MMEITKLIPKVERKTLQLENKGEKNPTLSHQSTSGPQFEELMQGAQSGLSGHLVVTRFKAVCDLGSLKGKYFLPFTTMGFPFKGMGGTSTLKKLNSIAQAQGAKVLPGAVACKMLRDFPEQLDNALKHIVRTIEGIKK